jgi:hypothetical protein
MGPKSKSAKCKDAGKTAFNFSALAYHDWNVKSIAETYKDVLEPSIAHATFTDASYMRVMEVKFLLRNVREILDYNLYAAFSRQDTLSAKDGATVADLEGSAAKKALLDEALAALDALVAARLTRGYVPRIVRLTDAYRLTATETTLFHLMVVAQGSSSATVLNTLLESDETR